MTTITKRAIKRSNAKVEAKKKKAEKKTEEKSNAIPLDYLPPMDIKTFNSSLDHASEKEEERTEANSHRIRDGLLLVLNERRHDDAERVSTWNGHFAWIVSERSDEAAKSAKKKAEDYFATLFDYTKDGSEDDKAKNRIRNRKTGAMQTMKFAYYLQKDGWLDCFRFSPDGGCFIAAKSALFYKVLEAARPKNWKGDADFKRNMESEAWLGITLWETRTTQVGRLSWAELTAIVVPSDRKAPEKKPDAKIADSGEASENFSRAATLMVSHFEPAKGIANVRKALQNIYDATKKVMSHPNLIADWTDAVEPALQRALKTSGALQRPDGKLEAPVGADGKVIPFKKAEMTTPEEVAKLPAGTPEKKKKTNAKK